jgi:type IV secretion system protein VirB3
MRDPIFKGATRPVMWFGVPQLVLLVLLLGVVLGAMWSFILVGTYAGFVVLLSGGFGFFILRFLSAEDPHRLLQRGKQLESWVHGHASRRYWCAHAASPSEQGRRPHLED